MKHRHFDVAVIGGGMAGLPIANKSAYKGFKTVVIEKELLGGTCLNRGCIPTKTMIYSAKVAHTVRTAEEFGVLNSLPVVDLAKVVERKNRIVERIRKNAYKQVNKNEHLTLIEGEAVFIDENSLKVKDQVIIADKIIVNTGARPLIPKIPGLGQVPFLTNRSILDLTTLPESLLIIGGGFIGVEFAQMFARFGSEVTILQKADRLVPGTDPEISEVLHKVFEKENINVILNTDIEEAQKSVNGFTVNAALSGRKEQYIASQILVAAGRMPNTKYLGLDKAGVSTGENGFIKIDDGYQTSQKNIWAIGDVTGTPMFTHSARDDADRIYSIIFKNKEVSAKDRNVPFAVFTDPEIASVGLTEGQAQSVGYEIKIGKQPFSRVARGMATGSTEGFVKIVADNETDKILGAQIIGPHAGELIHELVIAMDTGAKFQQISKSIHIHPTLSEAVNSAAGGVHRPAGDQ